MELAIGDPIAHAAFLDCLRAIYRHAGCELAYFDTDPASPLAFEVRVDEVVFSVGYDPSVGESSLFVYCPFGVVAPEEEGPVLRRLLELNASLLRERNATYCIDAVTQKVAFYLRCRMVSVDAGWLREELVRVAQQALQWRADRFLVEEDAPTARNRGDTDRPWRMFA